MPYFMNVLGAEFRQGWPIDPTALFAIGANTGNIGTIMSLPGPYDFSVNNTLTVNAAFDLNVPRIYYTTFAVNVAGATPSATMAQEVVNILNADPNFSEYFYIFLVNWPGNGDVAPFLPKGPPYCVQIYPKKPAQSLTWYVSNCGAESELQFNRFAKIKQMPTYFARDTITNRFTYPDGAAMLVQLDPTVACQAQLIVNAGLAFPVGLTNGSAVVTTTNTSPFTVNDSVVMFDGTTTVAATINSITTNVSVTLSVPWAGATGNGFLIDTLADWQLLGGRSQHEEFENVSYDGSGRITQIIRYYTGSTAGNMAVKIIYTYIGASTVPNAIYELPYTLQAADLIVPP